MNEERGRDPQPAPPSSTSSDLVDLYQRAQTAAAKMGKGAPRLDVRLLGRSEIRLDGRMVTLPSRAAQSLFAYLILSAGTSHRREKLATLLWPDADEENGRSYLRHALWRIRKALSTDPPNGGFMLSDDLTVGFDPRTSFGLDVAEFENGSTTVDDLTKSLSRYGGELLPGFFDEWAVLERERLEAVLPRKMQLLVDRLTAVAKWSEVVEWAERWISFGHAPESAYRALMAAHHELGDRARAVAAYQRCVDALRRDVDVEPSTQTTELYQRLIRTVPTRPPVAVERVATPASDAKIRAPELDATPPFKGLQHFDESDAALFFGREKLTERLLQRLEGGSFLAVVGASGSGKSSVLRAGLVPGLRRRHANDTRSAHAIHVLLPGAHPLEALAVALTAGTSTTETATLLDGLSRDPRTLRLHALASGSRRVVVVDQFEEVFTLCADRSEREEFIDNLLTASVPDRDQPGSVVIALRADFYAHCAEYPALRDVLARCQEYIGPMDADELRRAVEAPSNAAGLELEPGLTEHLLHEVGDEPGALPLLSHALLETWRRREGRSLTLRGYAATGGVRGAIARTAESFFESAGENDRTIARRLFVRLTELGDGTEDTRRRAAIEELTSSGPEPTAVEAVLRKLSDLRLITLSERAAEVSHEALIREWPRLHEWLDQDRESIRAHRLLTRAAIEWDRSGQDQDTLYRGARLQQALAWATGSAAELTPLERSFLDASRAAVEFEARERAAAAKRSRRRALYLAAAVIALMVTVGAAAFFAEQARANATAAELEQRRALLESARAAAENVRTRLDALRGAIAPPDLVRTLSLRAQSTTELPDRDLDDKLYALRLVAGPDALSLSLTAYLEDELVAVDTPPFGVLSERPGAVERSHRAREMLAGTEPRAADSACGWVAYVQSIPYVAAAGTPAVALAHYGPPCDARYALILEVDLARAGLWMAPAVAATDEAYLVDHAGRLLARSRGAATHLQDLSRSDIVARAQTTVDAFIAEGVDPLGEREVLAAVAPVGDLGWRVVVVRGR